MVLAIRKSVTELEQQSALTQSDVQVIRHHAEATHLELARNRAYIEDDQKKELRGESIKWLSVTNPSSNYLAARRKHQSTTGEWLVRHHNFEIWENAQNILLWLSGICDSIRILLRTPWYIHHNGNKVRGVVLAILAVFRLFVLSSVASAHADLRQKLDVEVCSHATRFRWVFYQVEAFKKMSTHADRHTKGSEKSPATLDGTYARILENIEDDHYQELAHR